MKNETPMNDIKQIILINDAFKREQFMRSKLEKVRAALEACVANLQKSEQIRYTGWVVLLKKTPEGFSCVGVCNPSIQPDPPEEFDICLPIPNPETLPEFNGF